MKEQERTGDNGANRSGDPLDNGIFMQQLQEEQEDVNPCWISGFLQSMSGSLRSIRMNAHNHQTPETLHLCPGSLSPSEDVWRFCHPAPGKDPC